jgi:hypothetical protein
LRISTIIPHLINTSSSFISLKESLNLPNQQSIAQISFTISITHLQTISTHTEITITEYTPTFLIPVEVTVVLKAVLGVPEISKRVGVLGEREVFKGVV